MKDNSECRLKTGGDPRALADFGTLREELNKLTHPARPDVDWNRVESLSLSLFRQNGVELQTACWYTLARAHLAGIEGLNEGLAILEPLITHHWAVLWPQPVEVRITLLSGLSQRLQAVVRTLNLTYTALPLLYQAQQHLRAMQVQCQRLALQKVSQMEALLVFMHNAAIRLEKEAIHQDEAVMPLPPQAHIAGVAAPRLSVARPVMVRLPEKAAAPVKPYRAWKGFVAGVLTTLVLGGAGLWGWQYLHPRLTLLPVAASEHALTELSRQSPLWLQHYGFALAAQAQPPESEVLNAQWQQHITANALPPEALPAWHQGMEGLRALTAQLNALDERKGKYLTGSELKSMVFAITQNFERSVPAEAQLYVLGQTPPGEPLPAALVSQTDRHLHQLLNRYMLIKQQAESSGHLP
ncbi:hypothetical protein CYR55_05885 [Chimaeribacter californicus]|uniref:Type VI secretion protein ImpA n=1 Tax=Chimaeribacter californicus TaxID=2060067 RepID=A0A2N5EE85_9GAMM|nr:VasL domain-containing protein [Chimaeribacter californicus]PLR40807.1 hypothetical protein CYR55_05885 [Chimaeribacter californicus]